MMLRMGTSKLMLITVLRMVANHHIPLRASDSLFRALAEFIFSRNLINCFSITYKFLSYNVLVLISTVQLKKKQYIVSNKLTHLYKMILSIHIV
jgi:hypothetical protein